MVRGVIGGPAAGATLAGVNAAYQFPAGGGTTHASGGSIAEVRPAGLPVRVEPTRVRWRVSAVVPCFNRPGDLGALLADLYTLDLPADAVLRILVVDNASEPPLRVTPPAGTPVEVLQLATNLGGSGGFNAGIRHALGMPDSPGSPDGQGESEHAVWLIDSDARVPRETLSRLLEALAEAPDAFAAAPALADPHTGLVFEIGGRLDRTGRYGPAFPSRESLPDAGARTIDADYLAACCLLVRASAIRAGGLLPDTFLKGDDVEWCRRLARVTGGRAVAVPGAVAFHPSFDRFETRTRYYAARAGVFLNVALRLGARARLRHAGHEVARAVGMTLVGRPDLARLHLRGLADASRGVLTGQAPGDPLDVRPIRAWNELGDALLTLPGITSSETPGRVDVTLAPLPDACASAVRDALREMDRISLRPAPVESGSAIAQLLRAGARWALGPRRLPAIVSGRGRPSSWFVSTCQVCVCEQGFWVHEPRRARDALAAAAVGLRGAALVARLLARPPRAPRVEAAPPPAPRTPDAIAPPRVALSVVVLSHNRWPALRRTLHTLREEQRSLAPRDMEIVVVDNASVDGTPSRLPAEFPDIRLIPLARNEGVAGFNIGVQRAAGEVVMTLDDDAWPEPGVLGQALALLEQRPDIGAVTLLPRHPVTGLIEWPFGARLGAPTERWPVMGCGNLIRRSLWLGLGGYDPAFFLYRNDVDLAMKLLAAGQGVWFDPRWLVWHDSPVVTTKSLRWFELATRNWIWLARRHGRGIGGVLGLLAGWAWAHRLAGLSPRRHARTLRGALSGLLSRRPPLPDGINPTGRAFADLLDLRLRPRGPRSA